MLPNFAEYYMLQRHFERQSKSCGKFLQITILEVNNQQIIPQHRINDAPAVLQLIRYACCGQVTQTASVKFGRVTQVLLHSQV